MRWLQDVWLIREIVIPLLDILIVAWIIYKIYMIIAETRAIPALKGIILILLTTLAANLLYLETLGWLLERFLQVAAIALIVLFQPELRRVLMKMGQGRWLGLDMKAEYRYLDELVQAADVMSQRRIGALIVFEREVGLKNYLETGTELDADISFELLMTIFKKESPLHDGAVIVVQKRLAAAACFLPLSQRSDIKKGLGTRHRAAVGISEETDAAVLVISEETGSISLAVDGKLRYDIRIEKLHDSLKAVLGGSKSGHMFWKRKRTK